MCSRWCIGIAGDLNVAGDFSNRLKNQAVTKTSESAYKPGSVIDNHSSRPKITLRLKQPTRFPRGPRVLNKK